MTVTLNKPNAAKTTVAVDYHSGRQWSALADAER